MSGVDIQSSTIISYLESLGFSSHPANGKTTFRQFTGTEAELESLHSGVGLRNLSHSGLIELRGKDVLDFLHRIATADLKDLPKENIAFTLFTNEKGRIIDKTAVLNFGDYQLIAASSENKMKVVSWINKYVIADDVRASDSNGKYVLFELLGPQADSFSTLLCGDMACKLNENTFKVVNSEGMLFFIFRVKEAGESVKYWIMADQDNGLKLIKYLVDNKGPFDFNLIGEDAYNIYRIELGIPVAPNELNDNINPNEASLLHLISFTKGCYIGQEVVARLDTYDKVQKHLRGIKFKDQADPARSYTLKDAGGSDAGFITSIVYSHKHKSYIALGYIKKLFAETGTELIAADEAGNELAVTVSELPFKR